MCLSKKVKMLSHLSIGHSLSSFVSSTCCLANFSLAFLLFAFNNSVLLGCLPLGPLCVKQWLMVRSDVDVPGAWSSRLISLEGFLDFFYHSNDHFLWFVINFPLAASTREVGYSPIDLKFLNNMCNCSHRNTKLLRDAPIPFSFNMLVHNFPSNVLSKLFPLLPLPSVSMSPNSTVATCSNFL